MSNRPANKTWSIPANNSTHNFYAQIRRIKQTFHETENYVSDHVYGWYLGVESFFMGMNWLCVQKVYSDHSLQRKSFRVFIFIENWRLTNPRKYLTGAGMVKAVNRYRAEASQVILKSVTEPLNWRKKKFENVKQLHVRTTARNLKGKETKRHRHILKISSLKLSPVPLLCNLSQGCHNTEHFESSIASFSTHRANLLLWKWILS